MRGTCFGAKNVESISGKLAFDDLAFDNFPIIAGGLLFVFCNPQVDTIGIKSRPLVRRYQFSFLFRLTVCK